MRVKELCVVAILLAGCESAGRGGPTRESASATAPVPAASAPQPAATAPAPSSTPLPAVPEAPPADASPSKPMKPVDLSAPIVVEPGESVAGIQLGMPRSAVATGITLTPEGVERVDRKGWVAGPLLVLCDPADRVVLVSVDLAKSHGLVVGGRAVPRTASLDAIARIVPQCTRSQGSGGDGLACRGKNGKVVHFWGTHGSPEIRVSLDAALLE